MINNGEVFCEAEFDAIRSARRHVHLEAYIFERGKLTDRLIDVLTERARAGVEIGLVLDAVGSVLTPARYFQALVEAGGRVEFYPRCAGTSSQGSSTGLTVRS